MCMLCILFALPMYIWHRIFLIKSAQLKDQRLPENYASCDPMFMCAMSLCLFVLLRLSVCRFACLRAGLVLVVGGGSGGGGAWIRCVVGGAGAIAHGGCVVWGGVWIVLGVHVCALAMLDLS